MKQKLTRYAIAAFTRVSERTTYETAFSSQFTVHKEEGRCFYRIDEISDALQVARTEKCAIDFSQVLMTTEDVAIVFDCSRWSVFRDRKGAKILPFVTVGKQYRYVFSEIIKVKDAFLARLSATKKASK